MPGGGKRAARLTEIRQEVDGLAARGYLEVMLLGQNVNSYGKDLSGGVNFAALLRELERVPGLARIRYMTSHPRDFSDELIETIRQSRKVCEHFHLPLQSGSNSVLERMNRGYTREQYLQLVGKIRRAIPAASITTDLICGFPGETEQEFQETLDLVQQVRFDAIYTFLYSPRPGTAAEALPGQVAPDLKKLRLARLMEVQNRISLEINQALSGQSWEVLVEEEAKPTRSAGAGEPAPVRSSSLQGKVI